MFKTWKFMALIFMILRIASSVYFNVLHEEWYYNKIRVDVPIIQYDIQTGMPDPGSNYEARLEHVPLWAIISFRIHRYVLAWSGLFFVILLFYALGLCIAYRKTLSASNFIEVIILMLFSYLILILTDSPGG